MTGTFRRLPMWARLLLLRRQAPEELANSDRQTYLEKDRLRGLSSSERDDAPNRIVGRNTDCHSIAGHDLDAKSAHPAAQLGEHLMTRIALHTVKAPAVDGHNGALHIN
jgi:hypothetical protein